MAKEIIGLSCIHVGTGKGGTISMLARVAVIDYQGQVLYDTYVLPSSPIESYCTATTGLNVSFFHGARPFDEVQSAVACWIENKIVIGHQLWNDFQVLGLSHPAINTRDVALCLPFRIALQRQNNTIGLQTLMWLLMRRRVQETLVDPLENTCASVDLFRSHEKDWEVSTTDNGLALYLLQPLAAVSPRVSILIVLNAAWGWTSCSV